MAEPTKAQLQEMLKVANEKIADQQAVDGIIESLNQLSAEQKKELTIKARTTPQGIGAYTAILYGA